jgi:DNA-binding MarR family transcriptional regulator
MMSIMIDNNALSPPADNIRTLLFYLDQVIDERLVIFRTGTPYEKTRPSDIRVFATAGRSSHTISSIARELGITRQAVQISVKKLQEMQLVVLQSLPDNKRDKQVILTVRGERAREFAREQVARLEKEFSDVIGHQSLEIFRKTLVALQERVRKNNSADLAKMNTDI